MANQFLSLSLFLMLLSFFIILNGLSDFEYEEERAKSVLNSLSLAFANEEVEVEKDAPSAKPTPFSDERREGDTLETLEGLFNAHIANIGIKKNRLGTQMHVRLPVSALENALAFPLLSDEIPADLQGDFLKSLITVLRSERKGRVYRIDMVMNIPSEPSVYMVDNASGFQNALQTVAGFAQDMERLGMPQKMVSAGLEKGEAGYIDLYFNRYEPMVSADFVAQIEGGE